MGYDGSVNIDTKLDTKGFNKGTKSISSSLGGVLKSIMAVAKVMAAAFIGGSIISGIRSVISSFDLMNSSIGGSLKQLNTAFDGLKSSFASLVLTAFAPLIPYIIAAVQWLTNLFTLLAQVTAALFGTSVAMASVKTETAGAGKEAKKAAGALAGFDQISVLSQQDNSAGGGGGGGGGVLPSNVVPPELLSKVQAFKEKMIAFLQPVIDALGRLKDSLIPLGETIWSGLKWAWDNILVPLGTWVITDLLPAFLDLLAARAGLLNEVLLALAPIWLDFFDNFLKPLAEWAGGKILDFLNWLTIKLGELAVWIKENPEKFRDFVTILGTVILSVLALLATFVLFTSGIAALTTAGLVAIGLFIIMVIAHWESLGETIKQIGFIVGFYVSQMADNIRIGFFTALDAIKAKFESIFNGIQNFVKGVINGIIGYINAMLQNVVGGLNGVIGGLNTVGSIVPGFRAIATVPTPQIPRLATGAVIPPNSQFAAILGDQRSGKNIEAPESLIRQIVREESGSGGGQNINITFSGSMAELVRVLKPHIDNENVRVGASLIRSGA